MNKTRISALVCAGAFGLGTSLAIAACGEDRGGVEVQGGGTTGATTAGATTPATTTTAP